MTQFHKNWMIRFSSIASAAAIAATVALPGLAQTTRPSAGTNPTQRPTTPGTTQTNPTQRPTTPGTTQTNPTNRPTPGTSTTPNTRPVPGTSTTPGNTNPGANNPTQGTISSLDREFVTLAYQGNNAEIQTSQLALQRSQNQQVRQYAERMIREHTQANQLLTQYANQRNIALPTAPVDPLNRAIAERLSQSSGSEFDRAYMEVQAVAHLRTVALFQTQANFGQEQGLRGYAAQLLPNIENHYQMASQMIPSRSAGNVQPGTGSGLGSGRDMNQPVR
ncbi:DUF4142 domain-containing protein [Oscillatoria sp. FACHB-1407]|uniref:DUF4142 domain-containing protein n=1 Tax=Oscillatoria sp. FACHB-1407 TaxID=2692847 RepID=UPI001688A9A0|nr:DUF4142 domain-containing protein [Oscillatoria sp. FACHB-1407]MBD2464654.1 DUF4142 domain-containing protein [Oscillatoria sp. FACHB-1407]